MLMMRKLLPNMYTVGMSEEPCPLHEQEGIVEIGRQCNCQMRQGI